jgi:hypothetical protein
MSVVDAVVELSIVPEEPAVAEGCTDSDTTLKLAGEWLKRCTTKHGKCGKALV